MAKLKLEIVTPEKMFFEGEVDMVIARTTNGDVGILKDHEPLVSALSIGAVKIINDSKTSYVAISNGFIFVQDKLTSLITDTAEWADEIDLERAKNALERAKENYERKDGKVDNLKRVKLLKAINRIRVFETNKDSK